MTPGTRDRRIRLRLERLEDRTAPAIVGQVTHDFVTHSVNIQHIDGFSHAIDPTATTWLVIHGRNDSAAGKHDLAESIHTARPNDQVLLLDWSEAAASGLLGGAGEKWIVTVATWAANALADNGFVGPHLNVVGHSWGAYVADEMAARFPGATGVNSIVALDPATHYPLDFEYNPEDGHIDFAAHSGFSWAFHARKPIVFIPAGSISTPKTADEAFTVTGADHNSVVDVFRDMLERPTPIANRFSLDRLVNHQVSSDWIPNRFTFLGTTGWLFPALRDYEAVLGTEANPDPTSSIHRRLDAVMYFDAANPNGIVPIIAIARDSGNQAPTIAAVLGPLSVKQGKLLTLTAAGVFDDSAVTAVQLYVDSNGDGTMDPGDALLGIGARSGNDWSVTVPTTDWTLGDTRLFVQAIDDSTPALSQVEEYDVTVVALPAKPRDLLATGTDSGGDPLVKLYDPIGGQQLSISAYDPLFRGGVRVATGDVNGDGVDDVITGPGPGGGPHIKVFDGVTHAEIRGFFAFAPTFTQGVWVASGDLNDDGYADIIVGSDAGGSPRVRIFSGRDNSVLVQILPYNANFTGGVRVASGDVNGDGVADLLTAAGPGGGPHVRAFSGATGGEVASFFAYSPNFTGGVFVAAGDTDGDGFDDFITGAGASGGPHVRVISGATRLELQGLFAANATFTGGVRVAAADFDGDGKADVATSLGRLGAPRMKVFKGDTLALIGDIQAYDPSFLGGVYVG